MYIINLIRVYFDDHCHRLLFLALRDVEAQGVFGMHINVKQDCENTNRNRYKIDNFPEICCLKFSVSIGHADSKKH